MRGIHILRPIDMIYYIRVFHACLCGRKINTYRSLNYYSVKRIKSLNDGASSGIYLYKCIYLFNSSLIAVILACYLGIGGWEGMCVQYTRFTNAVDTILQA